MDRGRHYRHLDGTKDSSATLYSSMPNTLRTDDMDTAQDLTHIDIFECRVTLYQTREEPQLPSWKQRAKDEATTGNKASILNTNAYACTPRASRQLQLYQSVRLRLLGEAEGTTAPDLPSRLVYLVHTFAPPDVHPACSSDVRAPRPVNT
ncbi:hypothetical protein MHUMG1_04641 [Metarhizium humberi]|uniref:Uncharacterized protein n=1 Tax=Metarhizium humberi TaxID=2596975 RepID=A0A9P8MDH0_9HYPO|nr:hypothetical protein MHUMG1_04641 [Metarhizium humberi]